MPYRLALAQLLRAGEAPAGDHHDRGASSILACERPNDVQRRVEAGVLPANERRSRQDCKEVVAPCKPFAITPRSIATSLRPKLALPLPTTARCPAPSPFSTPKSPSLCAGATSACGYCAAFSRMSDDRGLKWCRNARSCARLWLAIPSTRICLPSKPSRHASRLPRGDDGVWQLGRLGSEVEAIYLSGREALN